MASTRTLRASALSLAALFAVGLKTGPTEAQELTQSAIIDDTIHRYVNLDQRVAGGPGGGSGVDGDDVSEYPASATVVFSDFELNDIPLDNWAACRGGPDFGTVQTCLEALIGDGDPLTEEELHPGEIGGDLFEFDLTLTNTSPNAVLTAFGFQSKFSESPALGSRIGDKLFTAVRVTPGSEELALGGVKKNGTSNGLFNGKLKFICVNSSDDYPAALNAGTENETLECAGGRTFDESTNEPVLESGEGEPIFSANGDLPKGLAPGDTMTIRLRLDTSTDDGALHRAHQSTGSPTGDTGPLTGTLDPSGECPTLMDGSGNIVEIVDSGDVKILRNDAGNCAPSFMPFEKNQFLTFPRRNWGFTDILDTRDTWPTDPLHPDRDIVQTLDDPADGVFSLIDVGNLVTGELNFAALVKGFGEHGDRLDPACDPDGSQPGACGGAPYVPLAEFYAYTPDGKLVRQEVAGTYSGNGDTTPLTASIDQATATSVKATDPFEETGNLNPPPPIGGSASVEFLDFEAIEDDPATVPNEGGQAGGNRFRLSMEITNTSEPDSNVILTSINFQTKERALTDINDDLDGSSIVDRRDLRLDDGLEACTSPEQTRCFDADLGIGRFPNVIGNSLLSVKFIDEQGNPLSPSQIAGPLRFIKKNGPFTPVASGFQNFICVKSGAQEDDDEIDQDAIETCAGDPTLGLAPGESQTVRLELDYGDFRGLILRVEPGTIPLQAAPFGLIQQGGDFDCRDQRRLPYCHPDLVGQDWFTDPEFLDEVIYVTVHQEGDAPTVMNYQANFGHILAMGGFIPSAEFSDGTFREQVVGEYCSLPGGVAGCQGAGDDPPDPEPENQAPQAEFGFACMGLTCSFDASESSDPDGTIASFDWDFGDGNTGTGETVGHSYAAAGTYEVTLVVTDNEGATDTGIASVQVSGPDNAPPNAAFSAACDGLSCSFTDQSTDADGSIASWAWTFGDDATSDEQNPVHSYAAGGAFLVELTVTDDDGASASASQEVTVDAAAAGITLVLEPRRVRGLHEVQLTWSGATSAEVDIHRDGAVLTTLANDVDGDNTHLDRINQRGRGTYVYQVCEAGSTTACSEEMIATFN